MNPLPDLSQTYSMLLQEEDQRTLNVSSASEYNVQESAALLARQPGNFSKSRYESRGDLSCDYCKGTGHTRDKCYKLNGYPHIHKHRLYKGTSPGNRNSRPVFNNYKSKTAAQVTSVGIPEVHSTSDVTLPDRTSGMGDNSASFVTQAQYQHLLSLIQSNTSSGNPGKSDVSSGMFNSAHLAGNISFTSTCLTSITTINEWIIDSGATDHITPFLHLLSNPTAVKSVIHMPNGKTAAISHIGQICLNDNLVLIFHKGPNVYSCSIFSV